MNTQLGYRIDKEVKQQFEAYCQKNNLIANKTLEQIIKEWLQEKRAE
jgi:hypothetical protein